jgi:thiamine-monophosphate kinase
MDEFSLINKYFKSAALQREDVVLGIGDDAACLKVPMGMELLISTDTLVAGVHFLDSWSAYDIATKAVMVNLSDIAAMGGYPCWLVLALTLPKIDTAWLEVFSRGLQDSLRRYNIALIGGDMTRGALSMTLTIHGLINEGEAVRRCGAKPGDKIYVSGELGAAALAVASSDRMDILSIDKALVEKKLMSPLPRLDLSAPLRSFASAAIDISDGLSADLNHICEASQVGACLDLDSIPVHPLVKKYKKGNALDFALSGGDDYELCFTVPSKNEAALLKSLAKAGIPSYPIGVIETELGLRAKNSSGETVILDINGYRHF